MLAIGVVFLILAGIMVGAFGPGVPLGAAIYYVAPAFLNTLQAGVQRRLSPWLWDSVMLPILEAPSWVPFAVLGVVFVAWSAARRRRRRALAIPPG